MSNFNHDKTRNCTVTKFTEYSPTTIVKFSFSNGLHPNCTPWQRMLTLTSTSYNIWRDVKKSSYLLVQGPTGSTVSVSVLYIARLQDFWRWCDDGELFCAFAVVWRSTVPSWNSLQTWDGGFCCRSDYILWIIASNAGGSFPVATAFFCAKSSWSLLVCFHFREPTVVWRNEGFYVRSTRF